MATNATIAPRLDLDALLDALADRIAARIAVPTSLTAPPDTDWLTTEAAAKIIGVKQPTLEGFRCKGTGPVYHRLGRNTVRYKRADVMAWIDSNARTMTSGEVARKRRRK